LFESSKIDPYLAKVPHKLGVNLFRVGMLGLLEMIHAVAMTLELDIILLLLAILKGLHVEATNEPTNQAEPNVFSSSAFITRATLGWTLWISTQWTDCIVALH
jgi:hypothetical protein